MSRRPCCERIVEHNGQTNLSNWSLIGPSGRALTTSHSGLDNIKSECTLFCFGTWPMGLFTLSYPLVDSGAQVSDQAEEEILEDMAARHGILKITSTNEFKKQ